MSKSTDRVSGCTVNFCKFVIVKPFFSLLIFLAVASFCADLAFKVIAVDTEAVAADGEELPDQDENESGNEPDGKLKLREFAFISFAQPPAYYFSPETLPLLHLYAFHPALGQYTQAPLFSPPEMM